MRKINILMVGSSLEVKGGMTTVVQSFLKESQRSENINILFIPTHVEKKNNLYKMVHFLVACLRIFFIFFKKHIDVVHMHMSERGSFKRKYVILRLSKLFKKKVIIHTHGAEFKEFYEESDNKTKSKVRELLRKANLVITLGQKWDNIIKEIEPQTNTHILRNSVDLPDDFIINKVTNNEVNILFLAVTTKRKGIIDLINASPGIIKKLENGGRKVQFTIAGDGDLLNYSKKLTQELNLEKNFNFLGWVSRDDIKNLLKHTDLFILPSYNEGLPMSILEALSYAVPVVSTKVGSIDEAIKDNENGFLVEPGNIKMIEYSVVEILNNSNLNEYQRNSRKICEENFNNKNYFKTMYSIYQDLQGSSKYGVK
jgi:glycosyltransferase involved in cell wall biosynthesis